MTALSFSATEILPALLSHKKTQTIRPLWKKVTVGRLGCGEVPHTEIVDTKLRLKVGDITVLYWKQRGKAKTFCKKCGQANWKSNELICLNCGANIALIGARFPKLLGKVKITEVFEIEMRKDYDFAVVTKNPNLKVGDLAMKDGFKSAEKMFEWFNKAYDLSQRRKFAVYRWRYL